MTIQNNQRRPTQWTLTCCSNWNDRNPFENDSRPFHDEYAILQSRASYYSFVKDRKNSRRFLSAVSQDSYVITGCQAKFFSYFRCPISRYLYILYGFSLSFYRQRRIISRYRLVKRFVAFNAKYFTFVPARSRCSQSILHQPVTAIHKSLPTPVAARFSHTALIFPQ